jgi:hypothetical protein
MVRFRFIFHMRHLLAYLRRPTFAKPTPLPAACHGHPPPLILVVLPFARRPATTYMLHSLDLERP